MAEEKTKKEETFADIASSAGLEDDLHEQGTELEDISEDNEEESEEEATEEADTVVKPKVKQPWVDLNDFDPIRDLQAIPRNPLWIIITVLALLFLILFILMFIDLKGKEEYELLRGYVLIHHKAPEGYKKPLPKDIQEIIDIHNHKKETERMKGILITDDPREKEPYMGDFYPNTLSDEDLLLILEAQKIGEVTKAGVVKTELMNLSGLDLTKLSYKYMKNFVGANLTYTNFSNINTRDLIFRGASLQYSQFVEANIPGTNFIRTRLSYSNFFEANVSNSQFTGAIADKAHFQDTRMNDCDLNETIFRQSDFSNAVLDFSSARYAYFEGSSFRDASLIGVSFKNSNLKGVSFVNADLRGVNFENCMLEGANFEGADIEIANFKNADVTNVNFKDVKNATRKQLEATKFLISAYNIPAGIIPQKRSWQERFAPPVEVDGSRVPRESPKSQAQASEITGSRDETHSPSPAESNTQTQGH